MLKEGRCKNCAYIITGRRGVDIVLGELFEKKMAFVVTSELCNFYLNCSLISVVTICANWQSGTHDHSTIIFKL